jgi:hypothetical protein
MALTADQVVNSIPAAMKQEVLLLLTKDFLQDVNAQKTKPRAELYDVLQQAGQRLRFEALVAQLPPEQRSGFLRGPADIVDPDDFLSDEELDAIRQEAVQKSKLQKSSTLQQTDAGNSTAS